MFTERFTHPTVFDVLCATNLFATTFTVIQSSSNVVSTTSLSVGEFQASTATIQNLNNPAFNNLSTVVNNNSAAWTVVFPNSASWNSNFTTTRNASGKWESVYTNVNTNSANYILHTGNSRGTTLLVGTNDDYHLSLETAGTVRATILSGGNVGVGTATPAAKFEVLDSNSTDAVRITQTGSGNALAVYDVASDTTPFVIDQNGNVGVGISSPTLPLDVAATSTLGSNVWGYGTNFIRLHARTGSTFSEPSIAFQEGTTDVGAKIGVKNRSDGAYDIIFANRATGSQTSSLSERVRIKSDGNVGIGTNDPTYKLDVAGTIRIGGPSYSTGDAVLEVGNGRTGSGNSYIDLVGDTTYTDYGARLIRTSTGTNTDTSLLHRGTGNLQVIAQDGGQVRLLTNNLTRVVVASGGQVGIGVASPDTNTNLHLAESLRLGSTSTIRTIDSNGWTTWYSNANTNTYLSAGRASRITQNNGEISLHIAPSGTADSAITWTEVLRAQTTGNILIPNSYISTTGRFQNNESNDYILLEPSDDSFRFVSNDTERFRIATTGNVGVKTTDTTRGLTVVGDISATGTVFSSNISLGTGALDVINSAGDKLVLNAGESNNFATGQTGETTFINAESGVIISSSPSDWATGWVNRNAVILCNPRGNSAFGLSSTYIDTTPQATVDVFGTIKFGERQKTTGINAGGFLSNTWSVNEDYKFFVLGSTYFEPLTARWITNKDNGWGSNNISNIAGDTQGIKFYTSSSTGSAQRSDTTVTFNTYERARLDINGNFGIGTGSPTERLTVQGNIAGSNNLTILGNVGIGSNSNVKLGILGTSNGINANWQGGTNFVILSSPGPFSEQAIAFQETGSNIGAKIGVKNRGSGGMDFIVATRDTTSVTSSIYERFRITNDGRVGIGNNAPLYTLDIRNITTSQTLSTDPGIRVFTTSGYPQLLLQSSQATGYSPGVFTFSRQGANSAATPSNTRLGEIRFAGLDTNAGYSVYSQIWSDLGINASGGGDGTLYFGLGVQGAQSAEKLRLTPQGLSFTEPGQTARSATAPITISNAENTAKIDLYNNAGDRYGFGIDTVASGIMQIYTRQNGPQEGGIVFGFGGPGSFTENVRFRKDGRVIIGAQTGNTRLSITPGTLEPKITLWDGGSTTNHYGFGVSNGQLNYEVASSGNHVFYTLGKNGTGTELARINSTGLTVVGNISASGTFLGSQKHILVTTNFTASPDAFYLVDTTSGAITATLPPSPAVGTSIHFNDPFATWGSNNLTIGRNGSNIDSGASNLICDVADSSFSLVFVGGTRGWKVTQVGGSSI